MQNLCGNTKYKISGKSKFQKRKTECKVEMKALIDRLKIVSFRLSKYAISTSLQKELEAIIKNLEEKEG